MRFYSVDEEYPLCLYSRRCSEPSMNVLANQVRVVSSLPLSIVTSHLNRHSRSCIHTLRANTFSRLIRPQSPRGKANMGTQSNEEANNFPTTPYPKFDQDTKPVRNIACVIIGDEILNGKTLDTNSNHLAALSFGLGIQLKKIEVIPDEEDVIVSCLQRLCEPEHQFDMIITSGGIGPTHDDITYQSLAKVYDPSGELEYDKETIRRMEEHTNRKKNMMTKTEEQRLARHRMALFPKKNSQVLFVQPNLWVPVVSLSNKIFILPGVPSLFQQLLQGLLLNYIPLPPETEKPTRVLIETTLPESLIAPMLTKLTQELKQSKQEIKLGSYPNLITGRVTISLIGTQLDNIESTASLIKRELDLITQSSNIDNNKL